MGSCSGRCSLCPSYSPRVALSLGVNRATVESRQNYCGPLFAKKCSECGYHAVNMAGTVCPGGRVIERETKAGMSVAGVAKVEVPGCVACGEFVGATFETKRGGA